MARSDDLAEFHGEAREILEGIARDLVTLETMPADADLLNRIFRGAHSLKGLAGMLGFPTVSQMAHRLESVLDGVRMGRITVDPQALDVLLDTVEVVGRMVDAVRDEQPDREEESALAAAERLQALSLSSKARTGRKLSIDPEIAKILSEYEEHRLSVALDQGQRPWKVDVSFPFETFDTDLPALKERLKPYGEVITTMAGDLSAADRMGFALLVVSPKDPSVLAVAVAMPDARVHPIAVVGPDGGPPESSGGPAAGGGSGGAAPFSGFSANAGTWGIAELPDASALQGVATSEIDWNALAKEGEPEDRRSSADRRRTEEKKPGAEAAGATLRVNLERIDGLMNLVGELVTAKNAISQVAERLKAEHGFKGATLEIFKAKRVLERRLEDLQKGIMQVRMLPLENLFTKLLRVVRNLSRENGKDVDLVIEGADTELDKVMIDELSDPLIHIMRNAVDHGIEAAAVRSAAGKPPKGTLRIAAFPKGNHVAIEVSDDGGGLDADRIKAKAVEKGLLSKEAHPSEEELFDLIFAPGFSTKEVVSEVSGRGVGMDVVRNNIMKLNGIIDTHSVRGKGTRFTITLPLTLATMRALIVGVGVGAGEQTYAIPLASVLECVSPKVADLRTVEGREVLPLRESTLPLVRVGRFFGNDSSTAPDRALRVHVVVVGLAQYRIGLVVDRLGARQDVVVKPLGAPLTQVNGIMGATNLGNGRLVLVLDVAGVVSSAVAGRPGAGAAPAGAPSFSSSPGGAG